MSSRKHIEQLEALVAQDPTNAQLLMQLGEACQQAGDNPRAADAFVRAAACFEREGFLLKAVALLKTVVKLDARRADAQLRMADLHFELTLREEGIACLHLAGKVARREGDRPTELAAATKLVEAVPTNPAYRLLLAHVVLSLGEKDPARAQLAEAARLLQSPHLDLATTAAALELKDGSDTTRDELAAVEALRLELLRRTSVQNGLARLDFSEPN